MRVVAGRAFMVAADIRPGSPTLGPVGDARGVGRRPGPVLGPGLVRPRVRGARATRPRSSTSARRRTTRASEARDPLGRPRRSAIPWPVAEPLLSAKDAAAGSLADWLARPESAAFAYRPPAERRATGHRAAGTFGWCPRATPRWQHRDVHKPLVTRRRPGARPASRPHGRRRGCTRSPSSRAADPGRSASSAGSIGGGPATFEDFVVVLDLTIGGTILATGALVGRARAAEARRDAQLGVLQHAARRMSASLQPRGGRPRRRRGDAAGHRLPQRPRLPARHARRRSCPIAFEGRVGAYEKVDMAILRTKLGEGFTGWVALHGQPLRVDDATVGPARARRSRARTTSTSRCWWCRCSTTASWSA